MNSISILRHSSFLGLLCLFTSTPSFAQFQPPPFPLSSLVLEVSPFSFVQKEHNTAKVQASNWYAIPHLNSLNSQFTFIRPNNQRLRLSLVGINSAQGNIVQGQFNLLQRLSPNNALQIGLGTSFHSIGENEQVKFYKFPANVSLTSQADSLNTWMVHLHYVHDSYSVKKRIEPSVEFQHHFSSHYSSSLRFLLNTGKAVLSSGHLFQHKMASMAFAFNTQAGWYLALFKNFKAYSFGLSLNTSHPAGTISSIIVAIR